MLMKKIIGVSLATAAASMIAIAPLSMANEHSTDGKHACYGVNACKGQGVKGKNECKGKGFTEMTKAECTKANGKWGPDMKKEAKAKHKASKEAHHANAAAAPTATAPTAPATAPAAADHQ